MSDLNQILDEILNSQIYSPLPDEQADRSNGVNLETPLSNNEVPNNNESETEDDLDASNLDPMTKKDDDDDDENETEDVLQRNLQPRRSRRKSEENDENDEADDCQHVPDAHSPEKSKQYLDDENNRDHPTYVPRKGKFYEHDDRTSNGHPSVQQERSKAKPRIDRDAEGKWPHDLYFRDQQILKSTYGSSTRKSTRPGYVVHRNAQSNHSDDHHPSPMTRRSQELPGKDQHFHRKFINRQYQQMDKPSEQQQHARRQRQQSLPSMEERGKEHSRKPMRHVEIRNDLHHQRYSRPKSHHESFETRSKVIHQAEQPKRYSNMRQTLHPTRLPSQQKSTTTTTMSTMTHREPTDWSQVPLPPLTFFPQQHKSSTSYWYPQTSSQSPQVSRYFPTASSFQDQ